MVHSPKKSNRSKSFHFRYLNLCRSKNFPIQSEIKAGNNQILEFYGDKFKTEDWLLINEALSNDQVLLHIAIRLRKNHGYVLENINNEKKARMYKSKPPIFTNFILNSFVEGIAGCIAVNKNLKTLALEGLPLTDKYILPIVKALSTNSGSLHSVSFFRSSIGDKGCEILCNAIKCLPNIEIVNMNRCHLTNEGASYIADMIKFQKIYRYSEGWKQSLRYREVDPDSLQGLKSIFIAQNPEIGDEGAEMITEILKEDDWIKVVDMEECGLSDVGARYIIECLNLNRSIIDFGVRGNKISETMIQAIHNQLGKDYQIKENNVEPKPNNVKYLREKVKLLEERLATEKSLRKQVDILNEQLHEQLKTYERNNIEKEKAIPIPEGYTLVTQESLDKLVHERNELAKMLSLRPRHKRPKVRKAKSEIPSKTIKYRPNKVSKSEHEMLDPCYANAIDERIYIETNIGDTIRSTKSTNCVEKQHVSDKVDSKEPSIRHYPSVENFLAADELKIFLQKKSTSGALNDQESEHMETNVRALFAGI